MLSLSAGCPQGRPPGLNAAPQPQLPTGTVLVPCPVIIIESLRFEKIPKTLESDH